MSAEDSQSLRAKAATSASLGTPAALAVAITLERKAGIIDKREGRDVDDARLKKYVVAYKKLGGQGMKEDSSGDEADRFAKPTGSHIILPDEKNFYFKNKPEIPKADIVVPGGQFAIEGVDTPVNPDKPYLPKTKARIAKQQPKGKNPIHYGGPSVAGVLVVGGALLLVGLATTRKY
jgi:hypothetical protein